MLGYRFPQEPPVVELITPNLVKHHLLCFSFISTHKVIVSPFISTHKVIVSPLRKKEKSDCLSIKRETKKEKSLH